MNLVNLVDELHDELNGKKGIFSKKTDLSHCIELICEIKRLLASALSEAQEVIKNRNEIMQNADIVACNIIKEAEERAVHLTENSEIVRLAENKCREIVDEAYRDCDSLSRKTKEHLDRLFAETESFFLNTLTLIKKNRNELRGALPERK